MSGTIGQIESTETTSFIEVEQLNFY